jgi:hypothetical protein
MKINLNEDYLDNFQNKMKELKELMYEISEYKVNFYYCLLLLNIASI